MTDVATGTCASCGADIYGTRFCETCGEPAQLTTAATPPYPPSAAQPRQAATPLRVITLLLVMAAFIFPAIVSMIGETQDTGQALTVVTVLLYCGVGLLALLSAVAGTASSGVKLAGALLAIGFVGVFLIEQFTTILVSALGIYQIADATVYLLLFLSWAISRPFRGGGYFGILFLLCLEVLSIYIAQGLYASAGESAPILSALINCVFVLVVVGLSVLIENRRYPQGAVVPSIAIGGAINGKARASLTLALVGLGLNVLSPYIPYGIGLAASICAYGLFVVAIIVGHLARREIRTTGQRGAGQALAGMLIGYIIIGLVVVLLLVGAFSIASLAWLR